MLKKLLLSLLIVSIAMLCLVSCDGENDILIDGTSTNDDDPPFIVGATSYAIGDKGPAGGIIFYDCDADNTEDDPDGADGLLSSVCGWRYLEAAPGNLLLNDTTPAIGKPSTSNKFVFGYYRIAPLGKNLYVNGVDTYDSHCTGTAIGTGEKNTDLLVSAMKGAAYTEDEGSDTTEYYAAKLCSDLVYNGYDDWFLPSKDELNLLYSQNILVNNYISMITFWSSSENNTNDNYAWTIYLKNGRMRNQSRDCSYVIRPIRSF